MPHYSPFKVAETFSLLSALAPDRIDLGVGRALGSDGRTAFALQRDRSKMTPHDFPDQLAELLAYLGDDLPADHPFASLAATLPSGGGTPAPWLLGTSMESANWAASAGLPYCFADFINQEGAPIAAEYRRRFQPSRWLDAPYLATAIFTIAASTQEEAEALATPGAMMFSYLARGQLIPVPSLEKAMAWAAPRAGRPRRRKTVVGTPAKVRADLDMLGAQYGADELMLVNIMSDHAARLRSYALIAAEYGLAERAAAA